MTHEPHDPETEGDDNFDDVNKGIKQGTKVAGETVKAIREGVSGDGLGAAEAAAGAAGGVLGMIADQVDDEEARQVLEGVETGLEVAGAVIGGGEKLVDAFGGGGHGAHGAPSTSDIPGAGSIPGGGSAPSIDQYSGLGGATNLASSLADMLGGSGDVSYHLEVEGVEGQWTVTGIQIDDSIGGLPSCYVSARCPAESFAEDRELFDKDATLTVERGDQQRLFKGMVSTAHLGGGRDFQVVELSIVPALWLLSQTQDSRVFQDQTVPEIVESLFQEYLGDRHRTVRSELTEDYLAHEYLVQYSESHFAFIQRLCDEEGIYFFFDHEEGDHETLVLADSNQNRPNIDNGDEGRIHYSERGGDGTQHDAAFGFHRTRTLGPTDAVVSGYDWTNPPVAVRHDVTGRGESRGPALETHDHHVSVRHQDYDEGAGSYQSHTATRFTQIAAERHDLSRATWSVATTVIGVLPGHMFELIGQGEHDGRYLILRVQATGSGGSDGSFGAQLEIIPADLPYRPDRPLRPVMPGPETAVVVGDAGEEIDCDKHGRVKVQFHWDRRGKFNRSSSVWIRVMQTWAGSGFGAMFIPRIGMEVIVSFLGGDPDRPIITGCVYNGKNPVPYPLPEHKTRSTFMTNSSPGKNGFNELRFEDKNGEEEVYIHAEKDFNEEVKNCHSTHVGVDQSNTVDRDQTEHVKRDQTLTVDRDRRKTVKGNEATVIGEDAAGYRHELVYGDEEVTILQNRTHQVDIDDELTVLRGNKATTVTAGKWNIATLGEFKVTQNSLNEMTIHDSFYLWVIGRVQLHSGDGASYVAEPGGKVRIRNLDDLLIRSDGNQLIKTPQQLLLQGDAAVLVESHTRIVLKCGDSRITLTPSGIEITGPTVKINSTSGATEIDAASQVKIKC